jgi:CDGSH-type Zn-finger protein
MSKNQESKPKIVPLPNGPLYLINDSEPRSIDNLVNHKGEPLSTVIGIALCRCGQSKNKPFCDGTHSTVGFTSDNAVSDTHVKDKRKNYVGNTSSIIVHDNRRICSHSAECLRNLPSVFRLGERPWINADGAAVERIVETVRKCPSGALSYSIDGIEHRDQDGRKSMVTVAKNGPYDVTGGIELVGAVIWAEGASKEHYTLCRCGSSNNKPFCDGTHMKIKFRDDKS